MSPSNFNTSYSATRNKCYVTSTDFVSVGIMLLQAYGCKPVSLAVCIRWAVVGRWISQGRRREWWMPQIIHSRRWEVKDRVELVAVRARARCDETAHSSLSLFLLSLKTNYCAYQRAQGRDGGDVSRESACVGADAILFCVVFPSDSQTEGGRGAQGSLDTSE